MIRVSECKYLVALVYSSGIRIEKSETFLKKEAIEIKWLWEIASSGG